MGRRRFLHLSQKILEAGTFERPTTDEHTKQVTLTRSQLQMILQGIKLESVTYRKRYQQPGNA